MKWYYLLGLPVLVPILVGVVALYIVVVAFTMLLIGPLTTLYDKIMPRATNGK